MDWNEPGLDAYEALQRLHQAAANGDLGYEVQGFLDQGDHDNAARHIAASGGFEGAERAAELLGWAHEQNVDVYGGYREAPMPGSDAHELQAVSTYGDAGYDLGYGQGHDDGYGQGQVQGYGTGYEQGYDQGYGSGAAAAATSAEGYDADGYTETYESPG